ncbi:MAG: glycoside hydrolase family 88 protein [Candidatus Pseudobacter hemicellulosilyticus]|uniref:Glycoside hydrolase family 88 protein n=1 Tax=Candidatus Pseudobacter hemicellulosilyticus TaxID=3121375 RepID=A0AAJ5WNE9_9BACT|nr:MAG: glycoside hydrolase family 88 protein [Pseudobacter sp.]
MNSRIVYPVVLVLLSILGCRTGRQQQSILNTSPDSVRALISKVNNYWQEDHPPTQRAFWDEAAYHSGNMEAYKVTANPQYRRYAESWATHNQWKGAASNDRAAWKYSYGESNEYVLFGDWQICFQTYIDLYQLDPDPAKIARAKEVMEYQMSTSANDYWWWVDGLYMVMPVMTKLYQVTGDEQYLDKLHDYFLFADKLMYDSTEQLYYRDAKYIYPKHKTSNGKKDFWARGDGWVFAGLAKVLADLPADHAYRSLYESRFRSLAGAIKNSQQPEGYWSRSLLDPQHAPGPETSGTAFFTYGLLWGINNNVLDAKTYMPVVAKSWNYLSQTAVQPSGKIGYVQPIGERAIPGQVVDQQSTANFGVGAVLLAAAEMLRYLEPEKTAATTVAAGFGITTAAAGQDQAAASGGTAVATPRYDRFHTGQPWYDTKGQLINAHGGGVLYSKDRYYWFGEKRGRHASEGVTVYSSKDLYNWTDEGLAFSPDYTDTTSDIAYGCVMERPKVIYNPKTKKYVLWFHLELKGKGYSAARAAVAVSDKVTGPYRYLNSFRPNGNMSRDMTLFVDKDGSAYHIYSSRENYDLRIAKLSPDFCSATTQDTLLFSNHREAPALFYHDQQYYMITSGCTGWAPNKAILHSAKSLWGPWTAHPENPLLGPGAELTYGGQSTYILPVEGKKDAFIFMADVWKPDNLRESGYIWLPIDLEGKLPRINWKDNWQLDLFAKP